MSRCATCMMEECDAQDPKFIKLHEAIIKLRGWDHQGISVKKKPSKTQRGKCSA